MRSRQTPAYGLISAVLALALTGGCAATPPDRSERATLPPGGPMSPASGQSHRPQGTETAASQRPRVLATNLKTPWDLAILPDLSALVTLRDESAVVRIQTGEKPVVIGRIAGARPKGEGGLLGLALSPRFTDDHWVYLYFTTQDDNRVVRYKYSSSGLSSPQVILSGIPNSSNHNGGRLRFGPDGMLYITTGDVTAKPPTNAQDTKSLSGKILRVTAEGKVPPDNPFGNEVWSYGHRNVQGIAWDSAGRMYASEFGSNRLDELNLIRRGGNYGWPGAEGPANDGRFIDPLLTWRTREASPSGIAITPDGTVLIASLRGERLWATSRQGEGMMPPDVYLDGVGRLRAVEFVRGELWLLTSNTTGSSPQDGDDKLLAIRAP